MKAAMVVTWTATRPGRERRGLAYAHQVDEFFGRFAAEGKCTTPKWFFSNTGLYIWFVEGEMEDLLEITSSLEAQKLVSKGPLINEGFRSELCPTERDTMFGLWEQTLDELDIN